MGACVTIKSDVILTKVTSFTFAVAYMIFIFNANFLILKIKMTSMDEVEAYEHSQARVMEFLIQQCVTTTREADTIAASSTNASQCDNATANATIMDLLAQTCADANAAVHELSVEEMADGLARAVYSTQKILRSVGQNVSTILQDSEQMQELCDHVKQTDTNVLETLRPSSMPLEETSQGGDSVNDAVVIVASDAKSSEAIISFDEENVRTIMVFAETMCTTMDHALSTITKEEMDLAAQLSLNIAQKLLHAGQSLFTSLGDDERRKARAGDRSDRITIEEVADKDDQEKDGRLNSQQVKSAAVLRMCVTDLYTRTREMAVEHPFLAGVSIAAGLPFIGLAVHFLLPQFDVFLLQDLSCLHWYRRFPWRAWSHWHF